MKELPVMIVTGTRRGIGHGIAKYFAGPDYQVIGCSRGEGPSDLPNYQHYQVDLTEEKEVRKFVRTVKKEYKRIDNLVCNVGLVKPSKYVSLTSGDEMGDYIKTNFLSSFYICREVSKLMMSQEYGRIVNLSSIMTGIHAAGSSAYSSTKSAVEEMTKVMAEELAPTGVTCNVVAPSTVMTDTVRDLGEDWLKEMWKMQSMKRVCNQLQCI